MEKQEKKRKKSNVMGMAILILFGAVFGFTFGVLAGDKLHMDEWGLAKCLWAIAFLFIAQFLSVNIHEFGHFLFGKLFGYRLLSYRISFLTWNNENGKMKFSVIRNKGYGGLCAMLPPEQALADYKNGLFYGGGVLFNLVSGVVFLLCGGLLSPDVEMLRLFFVIMGAVSLLVGLSNLIPVIYGNNPSDGKIIWSLLLKKPFAQELLQLMKLSAQLTAGIRPRDLQLAVPPDEDNPTYLTLLKMMYLYFKVLDSRDYDGMRRYADLLLENIELFPHMSLPSLYYELCYMAAISGDAETARGYYEKGGKILQKDKDINGLRVKAYYAYYVEKNRQRALDFCEKALAVADKFPIKGQGLMEKDLVVALQQLIAADTAAVGAEALPDYLM